MANISKDDLQNIKNELLMSKKLIEEQVEPQMHEAVARYVTDYIPTSGHDWDIILNEIYPIVQFELPSIFFRNPRIFLKPRTKNFVAKRRDPLTGRKVDTFLDSNKSAKTQEHLLNYLIDQMDYKKQARRTLMDSLIFKYGVLWHGYKGEFGITEEDSIFIESEELFVKRISPRDFIFDPKVTLQNIDDAQWVGRKFQVLIKDLKEDPNISLDQSIKGELGFGELIDLARV